MTRLANRIQELEQQFGPEDPMELFCTWLRSGKIPDSHGDREALTAVMIEILPEGEGSGWPEFPEVLEPYLAEGTRTAVIEVQG